MQSSTTSSAGLPNNQPVLTPALLYSLTIYNPTLGPTDETIHDQIVFHCSREDMLENEKLRQIGLAQGVAEFSKVFSKTGSLSSVETEKSRIILYEAENNWWILAYIDFTKIQHPDRTEFSNKEVSPPQLLNAQLASAYEQFQFLYGGFETAFTSLGRNSFCRKLDKFWSKWSWRWEVTLHGNPASDLWGGIRIAQPKIGGSMREVLDAFVEHEEANGLLDMVVARYGKVEMDVLKETTKEVENDQSRASSGLSNIFFSASRVTERSSRTTSPKPVEQYPREVTPSDGCVYLGRGKLDASSVRDISKWITTFYTFNGDVSALVNTKRKKPKRPRVRLGASGGLLREVTTASLSDNSGMPSPRPPRTDRSPRRLSSEREHESGERPNQKTSEREQEMERKARGCSISSEKKKIPNERDSTKLAETEADSAHRSNCATNSSPSDSGIPSSLISGVGGTPSQVRVRPRSLIAQHRNPPESRDQCVSGVQPGHKGASLTEHAQPAYSAGKILDYLTFGWSGGRSRERDRNRDSSSRSPSEHDNSGLPTFEGCQERKAPRVRFVIGLQGELDNLDDGLDIGDLRAETSNTNSEGATWKITERAVWIKHKLPMNPQCCPHNSNGVSQGTIVPELELLQFNRRKDDNFMDIAAPKANLEQFRLVIYANPPFIFALFFHPDSPQLPQPPYYRSLHLRLGPLRGPLVSHEEAELKGAKCPVYDFFYDPANLRQTCSIPNIPPYDPYGIVPDKITQQVSRLDAINIHSQILCNYGDVDNEKERKSRTTRGWWVAWHKLSGEKEAVLVWKGGDVGNDGGITVEGDGDTAGGGLLDTKKYFEVLMRASLKG